MIKNIYIYNIHTQQWNVFGFGIQILFWLFMFVEHSIISHSIKGNKIVVCFKYNLVFATGAKEEACEKDVRGNCMWFVPKCQYKCVMNHQNTLGLYCILNTVKDFSLLIETWVLYITILFVFVRCSMHKFSYHIIYNLLSTKFTFIVCFFFIMFVLFFICLITQSI